jgi:RNA polymerase sigma factor (sigma-70 family)
MTSTGGREAVIAGYVRSPIGRYSGALASVRPDTLAAHAIRALLDRTRVDPASVDDVILGCANQAGEDNRNVARMAALIADLPVELPGQTVNRLCGSGLQALNSAAQAIWTGQADLVVAGGVESMTRAPIVMLKASEPYQRGAPELADSTLGWRFPHPDLVADGHTVSLGQTAENVAARWRVSRAEQDELAAERDAVRRALGTLGARDRELIALKYHADLSNGDIAEVLGVNANHVGTLLHRAMNKLREAVDA